MNGIITQTFKAPPINTNEVLRYATANHDQQTLSLLNECIKEASGILNYKVCYCLLDFKIDNGVCDFNSFSVTSQNLSKNLKDCNKVIIMGATIGVALDRLISKYSRISPAKALLLQAFGAERIEALCDTFCTHIEKSLNFTLKPRFSAGYGDLPLSAQNEIFKLLDCPRRIGLTLNDSYLMSPSKSVTAFIGVQEV